MKKKLMFRNKISHSFFTWLELYKLTHPPHLEDHLEDNDIKNLSLFDFNLFSWKGTRVLGRISSMFCSLPRSRRVLQVTILLFLKLKKQLAHRFVNRFWKRSFNNLFFVSFFNLFQKQSFRLGKKRSFLKTTQSFWTFRKRITIVF